MTPLKWNTSREKALQQYQKLNNMISEKNLERVRKLQGKIDQDLLPVELRQSATAADTQLSENGIFMNKHGEPMTQAQMPPSHSLIFSSDGAPVDATKLDIANKSIQ